MIPAIILSSHTIGLGVIRSLGPHRIPISVFYYDKKDFGYVSKYVSYRSEIAHPERQEDEFIESLLTYGREHGRGVLFPVDDATITAVSKNKVVLEDYFLVACPGWDVVQKFIDKTYTYSLAEAIGIPTPRSLTPDCEEAAIEFGKTLDFPCLVKPCQSHLYYDQFKRKMVKVESLAELTSAYRESLHAGIKVMIQEYIPGEDMNGANYNSFFWHDRPLVEFTAEKCRLAPPDTGIPRVVKSRHIPEIVAPGRNIVKALGFNGYSCTEFKKDVRDDTYKLMEVNGRHNRSALLSVKCGINFPLLEYRYLTGGDKERIQEGIAADEVHAEETYWIDEFWDFVYLVKGMIHGRLGLTEYTIPYRKNHIYSVFDIHDVRPFVKRLSNLAQKAATPGGYASIH